jgi:thioesterase domain-containing protein
MRALPNERLVVPMSTAPGPVHTVLLHPAGGGLTPYLAVAAHLAGRGPVTAVRASGLLPGEQPHDSVEAMVEAYLPLLAGLAQRPTLLVGWSLGGMLAWELAGRLADTGPVPAVVAIDSRADARPVDAAGQADLVREVLAHSAAAGPAGGGPAAQRLAGTVAAHVRAVSRHSLAPHRAGPTLLLACGEEDVTGRLGDWPALAGDRLRVERLPGGHFDVFSPAVVPLLLAHLDRFLQTLGGRP